MANVFISFRNGDEPYAAALIYHHLVRRYGKDAVFRSSDSIPPGSDWAAAIWEHHRRSDVVVVVVGPRWLTIADSNGRPRLRQRDDWVRREVAVALGAGKHIIPVLLAGTARFRRKDLPASIAGLAAYQSVPMDHRTVDDGVQRLATEISRRTGLPDRHAPGPEGGSTGGAGWLGVWNVPARMPGFVERPDLLGSVREALIRAGGQRPVLVHGGVGAGKTQLAVEYAYRFAGDHHLAWWVDGASPELLWTQLAGLGQAVGTALESGVAAALPALARELHRRGRWLLVFDGFADPALLAEPLAAVGPGADVLITSRRPDWGLLVGGRCQVGHFNRGQSAHLLAGSLPGEPPAELDRVAAAVDDLPLAVAQAAGFLAGSAMPAAEYTELVRTRSRELLARGETYLYPRSLAAAWSVGVDRLVAEGGQECLELLAVLAPAPVPPELLDPDPIRRADVLGGLAGSGLVPVVDGVPHPSGLFQAFVREGMAPERVAAARERARQALARLPRPDPRTSAAWTAYQPLLPHVMALELVAGRDPGCQALLLDTAHHLVVRGDPATARDLAGAAVAGWSAAYGPHAQVTLDAQSRLAQALFRLRDYRQALAIDEQVFAGRRQHLGPDAPGTLEAAHNVAMARLAADPDDPAVPQQLVDVMARRRRVLGPAHADTLRSVHNLALVRRATGDPEGAWELDRENHRMLSDVLGPDHPDTLRAAYAATLDLRALGRAGPARELAEETHRRCRAVLGDDHPDTLRCGYGLAVDRWRLGGPGPARELAEEIHRRCRTVLGDGHPDTLRAAYLLGSVLRAGGDPAGERMLRDAAGGLRRLPAG